MCFAKGKRRNQPISVNLQLALFIDTEPAVIGVAIGYIINIAASPFVGRSIEHEIGEDIYTHQGAVACGAGFSLYTSRMGCPAVWAV
jgi:hypothetical protein